MGLSECQGPPDHFDYNSTDYCVQIRTLHGTEFGVAIHESALAGGPNCQEFAEYVLQCFHLAWHVFGGYVYDRYGVKVRSTSDSNEFSLSPVGVSISATDYTAPYLFEFIAHEMFHSLIGKQIKHQPDNSGNIFQLETWITEGATTYYGIRHMSIVKEENLYTNSMINRWNQYLGYVGTQFDLSIENLAIQIGESTTDSPDDHDYVTMLYARSLFLNYMLDLELTNASISLDSLMRNLYENYGLTGEQWKQEDIPSILENLAGHSLEPFLNAYLHTNAYLPLDGIFQLLRGEIPCPKAMPWIPLLLLDDYTAQW